MLHHPPMQISAVPKPMALAYNARRVLRNCRPLHTTAPTRQKGPHMQLPGTHDELTLLLAENVAKTAELLANLIRAEEAHGANSLMVNLYYDLLDSELQHLKDRYDISLHAAPDGRPPLVPELKGSDDA